MFKNCIKQQYLLYDNVKIKSILSKRIATSENHVILCEKGLKSENIILLFNVNCILFKA